MLYASCLIFICYTLYFISYTSYFIPYNLFPIWRYRDWPMEEDLQNKLRGKGTTQNAQYITYLQQTDVATTKLNWPWANSVKREFILVCKQNKLFPF